MHEWALAEAVISAACEVAGKHKIRQIAEVKVRVGELQAIELDVFRFALSQLKRDKLVNTKFVIRSGKARLKCRVCCQEWIYDKRKLAEKAMEAIHFIPEVAHAYVKCPKCGSPDFEIVDGRGVWLQSVKGE
jgi:hydrogenase nickel incorporation protein HypA/HybF